MRTAPRSLMTLTTTLVGIALATSACSGGDPDAEPTPKVPTGTASTTSATPEPEAWEVESRAGVKAFLQRYVDVFSQAISSGDTTELQALSTNCDGCDQIVSQIDDVYAAGGHIKSAPFRFAGWSIDKGGVEGGAASVVRYRSTGTTWFRSKGAAPERYPGGVNEKALQLEWTGANWTITALANLDS